MEITSSQIDEFLAVCQRAAHAGGQELLQWLGKAKVTEKKPGDFVTEADFASQKAIRKVIADAFPAHSFVGEENDGSLDSLDTQGFCWIVDPLDGTTNFIHQLRSFSVSIALAYQGQLIVGTVLDPVLEESFSAAHGKGAFLNGEPIKTSDCDNLATSLLVCSFPSRVPPDSPEVKMFLRVMQQAGSVRRLGSAALNFCYVACGRLDAYWATCVNLWDVAAGIVILREAGGTIQALDGGEVDLDNPKFVASANKTTEALLLPLMQEESN